MRRHDKTRREPQYEITHGDIQKETVLADDLTSCNSQSLPEGLQCIYMKNEKGREKDRERQIETERERDTIRD